ncbi:hypothetical protein THAOC_03232 [Thalassiosira oceanica]|uniref:Uncharacterized protein n=1 Tax=Thalassiosira oceanica TaxID=159749 RepID=K0TPX5_THAOC|nr:hypothetical protein THAOC_03232 [Thalassiosira oceanica]|eukprot:EJK75057.1 hypothetical protein THAOC_03232 [Thalassiosira oceanica]
MGEVTTREESSSSMSPSVSREHRGNFQVPALQVSTSPGVSLLAIGTALCLLLSSSHPRGGHAAAFIPPVSCHLSLAAGVLRGVTDHSLSLFLVGQPTSDDIPGPFTSICLAGSAQATSEIFRSAVRLLLKQGHLGFRFVRILRI